jgi:hypothetical protein
MGDLIMNKLSNGEFIGLCVAGVVAIIAIYAIISLIADYREEVKKSKALMSNLKTANNMPVEELDGYQDDDYVRNTTVRHFTDSGRVSTYEDSQGSTQLYEGFQFVIIKSVIHTETREALD